MKRSNSAPMIPELVELKPPPSSLQSRRGLSSSNVSLPGDFARPPEFSPRRQPLSSPIPICRLNSPTSRHRVEQLKKEESIDERKNEREVQAQIQLSHSWEELKLVDPDDIRHESMEVWPPQASPSHQPFVSPSSPLTKCTQCTPIRSRSLTPTSPSSARTFTYRRSCSPVLRPSTLHLGKRKREPDQEEMDTSPGVPSKRLQLGYASPSNNLSPCISPLTGGNSPLHHSFSTSRKSSSQSESALSSPSSIGVINPFAVNYDSGNCEHWQSGGSTCSSAAHSPCVGLSVRTDMRNMLLDEAKMHAVFQRNNSPGIIISEDQRNTSDFQNDISETPTPLSPKGLQFRHKPLNAHITLPSPIPRLAQSAGMANTNPIKMNPMQISKHSLHHDKLLSPFNSGLELAPFHGHSRHIRPKGRFSHLSASSLGTARQMNRPEPLKPSHMDRSSAYSSRLVVGSPLSKAVVTSLDDGPTSALHMEQRLRRKRRESETSNDSRDESFMESDSSLVSSLEESLELTENKDFGPNVVTTLSY